MRTRVKRFLALVMALMFVLPLTALADVTDDYLAAQTLLAQSRFAEAAVAFGKLGSYEEASLLAMYCRACAAAEAGDYADGIAALRAMGDYKDCAMRANYYRARELEDAAGKNDWDTMQDARAVYKEITMFLDSAERIAALDERIAAAMETEYAVAVKAGEAGRYDMAVYSFWHLGWGYKDSGSRATYYDIRRDEDALAGATDQDALIAVAKRYTAMGLFLDSADRAAAVTARADAIVADKYAQVDALIAQGKYTEAEAILKGFGTYGKVPQLTTYVAIRKDEAALTGTTDQDKLLAVAKRYAQMGDYRDSAARAASVTVQVDAVVADKYAQVDALIAQGKYTEAETILNGFGTYGNGEINAKHYAIGVHALETGKYDKATSVFKELGDYSDAKKRVTYVAIRKDEAALVGATDQDALIAVAKCYTAMGLFLDSADRAAAVTARADAIVADKYAQVDALIAQGKYTEAETILNGFGTYGNGEINAKHYAIGVHALETGKYDKATSVFKELGDYSDAKKRVTYVAIRKDEAALVGATDQDALIAVAKRYTAMGLFLDSADRAAAVTARADAIVADKYAQVDALIAQGKYTEAETVLKGFGTYRNDSQLATYVAIRKDEAALVGATDQDALIAVAKRYTAMGLFLDSAARATAVTARADAIVADKYAQLDTLIAQGNHAEVEKFLMAFGTYGNERLSAKRAELLRSAFAKAQTYASRIAAGRYHAVGLRADGTVVAVGANSYGQCNVSGWTNIVAIAAGDYYTVGLRTDGTVVAVGANSYGQCNVSGWTNIVAIAAGENHTIGLRADGTVVATGSNTYGQCGVSSWRSIISIACGDEYTVGMKLDGTVVAVGRNSGGQCDVSGWTDIVAIAAGRYHTVGLRADGTVVAVGYDSYGECDVSGWMGNVAIAAGGWHTVGLRADGTVVAVGKNDSGQCNVSRWTDVVAIAAGENHTIGLCSDGTVIAVGLYKWGQLNVSSWDLID